MIGAVDIVVIITTTAVGTVRIARNRAIENVAAETGPCPGLGHRRAIAGVGTDPHPGIGRRTGTGPPVVIGIEIDRALNHATGIEGTVIGHALSRFGTDIGGTATGEYTISYTNLIFSLKI